MPLTISTHVLTTIGGWFYFKVMIVMELMENGDLKENLISMRPM